MFVLTTFPSLAIAEDGKSSAVGAQEDATKVPEWNIEETPGKTVQQTIDTTEGTWITVDVSPDGKKLVFDLLGDMYEMPIEGADGEDGRGLPKKLTSGVAWDMQPAYSPDGQQIAFTSDRTGADNEAGDNLWILSGDNAEPTQVT